MPERRSRLDNRHAQAVAAKGRCRVGHPIRQLAYSHGRWNRRAEDREQERKPIDAPAQKEVASAPARQSKEVSDRHAPEGWIGSSRYRNQAYGSRARSTFTNTVYSGSTICTTCARAAWPTN